MAPKVELIKEIEPTELGEGPHWDDAEQCLYFVDIFGKSIHKYVPETKQHTKAVIGTNHVSLIIPVEGEKNKFLISIGRELAIVTWDGLSKEVSNVEKIYEVDNEDDVKDNRFNDGKCDPSGRLWAGTMGGEPENGNVKREKGSLYSFFKNKTTKHLSKIGISNGLAWDQKLKKMYYIDTHKHTLEAYDFDIENGTISNGKVVYTISESEGYGLDGMAIDTDGNLWIAVFGGYKIIKIDPRKPQTKLQTIEIPPKQVTSVAFGGKNLNELFVTSSNFRIGNEALQPPVHGGTYRISGIDGKGYPGVRVVL